MTLGVCGWSLRPRSPADLAEMVRAAGLSAVQLALDPIRTGQWDEPATRAALARAGVRVRSGMMAMRGEDYSTLESIRRTGGVRPDAIWPDNLAAAEANAALARDLGLPLVTLHAGFLPHDPADPEHAVMIDRLRRIARVFNAQGVRIGFETGQETADTLAAVLPDLAGCSVGLNFDPANMILYGMGDPVRALARLAPHVVQLHIKDARPAARPGDWGAEVVVGTGGVDWAALGRAYREAGLACDLMIEREGGDRRVEDVAIAVAFLRSSGDFGEVPA